MSKVLIGSVRGPAGPAGPAGPVGPAGPNTIPTQEAIATAVTEDGPAKEALSAAIGETTVAPDTGANVTAQLRAEYEAMAGKTLAIRRPGVYLVDTLQLTQPGGLYVGPGVTLRLRPNATGVAAGCPVILVTSSNVQVQVDGIIDANREGQSLSAYNAAGGSSGQVHPGIQVAGTSSSRLTGVSVNIGRVRGALDFLARFNYVDSSDISVAGDNGGAGVSIVDCDNLTVPLIALRDIDNMGASIYPHVFDLTNVTNSSFGTVRSVRHFGSDTVAAGGTKSDWISGATLTNVKACSFDELSMSTREDDTQTKGVGISFLSVTQCQFGRIKAEGYTDLQLEWAGVNDCSVSEIYLDGRYQKAAVAYGGNGWLLGDYGYYEGTRSRSQRLSSRNTIGSVISKRHFGDGIDIRSARDNTVLGGKVFGNRRGLHQRYIATDTGDNFATRIVRDMLNIKFANVDFFCNERGGAEIQDGTNTVFENCGAWNNGQAKSYPGGLTRLGVAVGTATLYGIGTNSSTTGLIKRRMRVDRPTLYDDQNFTDALSGTPGTGTRMSARDPERYVPGQVIRLVGAGAGGADLVTRVQDVQLDEVILEDAPSAFTTVAGTGTISTSGTAVTGSGTLFLTEDETGGAKSKLNARYWISASGQLRQIIKVASDTQATLNQAFPSNLPVGTAFTIYKTVTQGIPSQQYGVRFSSDTVAPQYIAAVNEGHTIAPVLDSSGTLVTFDPAVDVVRHPNRMSGQQATMDRDAVASNSVGTGTGTPRLAYFTADESGTFSKVRVPSGGAAAAPTPTLCRIGVYREEANGSLARIGQTANDTGLWAAASTRYTRDLQSPITLARGQRYALAVIVVSGSGTPNLLGQTALHADEIGEAPRRAALVSGGQTDLPETIAVGLLANTTSHFYGVLTN